MYKPMRLFKLKLEQMFQNYFKAFRVSSMDCRSSQVFDNLVFFLLTANETEAFIFYEMK